MVKTSSRCLCRAAHGQALAGPRVQADAMPASLVATAEVHSMPEFRTQEQRDGRHCTGDSMSSASGVSGDVAACVKAIPGWE